MTDSAEAYINRNAWKGAVTYSSLLEEIFASLLTCCVACSAQMVHVDKCRASEHDRLEQDQADFTIAPVRLVDHSKEIMQI
jgi:hypothetical protein